ncbi:MAG: Ig-like domain-containing protein [Lachnospiraceae bacterium]|nr:Ig-like domain-containing protein [Lachnospiraceae bacterium]
MKKITKMLVLALALVVSLSLGAGSTAEAAKKKAKVTVKKVTSVDKLTGSKTITLTKGKKATLKTTVSVTPNKAANKKVTYKSSNKKVATVSSSGKITAKKTGSAKITVTSKKNKKKKATVKVKVVAGKVKSVDILGADKKSVNKKTISLKMGANETVTLTSKVKTSGKKPNKTLKWSSSNTKVATVSKGKVTAKGVGTAKITVKSTDGTNKSATVTIKVEAADKNYKTTVAPVNGKEVSVEVAFTDAAKLQDDINKIAAFSSDKEVVVNLDGKDYTATVEGGVVKINGKTIAQSETAKNAKKVTVKTTIKSDKIAAVTAFTPASVTSVKIGSVTFTNIKADSFTIGSTTYKYTVSGKDIVVDGDAKAALAGLGDVVTVSVTEAK